MEKKIVKEYDVTRKNCGLDAYFAAKEEKESVKDTIVNWFKYSIIVPFRDWWWNVYHYVNNRIVFNKILWTWRNFDYKYQVELFAFGLEKLANAIENGHEVEVSRNKKVAAIRRLIEELNTEYEDGIWEKYMDKYYENTTAHITEYEDGSFGIKYKDINKDEYAKSLSKFQKALKTARNKHYKTIFHLIEGQDNEKVSKIIDDEVKQIVSGLEDKGETVDATRREQITEDVTFKYYDGSNIETWWD